MNEGASQRYTKSWNCVDIRGLSINVKCPYRSRCGTGTGVLGVFLLVWVPSMDLYEYSNGSRFYSLAESSFFSGTCMPKKKKTPKMRPIRFMRPALISVSPQVKSPLIRW